MNFVVVVLVDVVVVVVVVVVVAVVVVVRQLHVAGHINCIMLACCAIGDTHISSVQPAHIVPSVLPRAQPYLVVAVVVVVVAVTVVVVVRHLHMYGHMTFIMPCVKGP